MKEYLKSLLIPHPGNDHKPHIFREFSIIVILAITVWIFVASVGISSFLKTDQGADIYATVLVDIANRDRQKIDNLPPLSVNPLLVLAAQSKAEDMASKGYFAHNSPQGLTPWYWISKAGYPYLYAGENLAIDFNDSEDVENAWMNSPLHRKNILDGHFTEVGIGLAKGEIDGRKTLFVVQMFGSQRVIAQAPKAETIIAPTEEPIQTPTTSTPGTQATSAVPSVRKTIPPPRVPQNINNGIEIETVSSTPTYVSVKVKGESVAPTSSGIVMLAASTEGTVLDRIIGSPIHSARALYASLLVFILVFLSIFILVKREIQHPKNIGYALLMLLIICTMVFIQWLIFAPTVAVL